MTADKQDAGALIARLRNPSLSCSKGCKGDIHIEAAARIAELEAALVAANARAEANAKVITDVRECAKHVNDTRGTKYHECISGMRGCLLTIIDIIDARNILLTQLKAAAEREGRMREALAELLAAWNSHSEPLHVTAGRREAAMSAARRALAGEVGE